MNEETKIEAIFRAVESITGVSKEEIQSPSRKREICDARIMCAMLMYRFVIPYHICTYIHKNPCMIFHYKKKFHELYEWDKQFKQNFDAIIDNLQENNVYL